MHPLAVDLCCGLGGWSHGLIAEGWDVIGYDIEKHEYNGDKYPGQLVIQDIRTIDGRQFRGKVSLITASPPCTEFSYLAMPWSRGKSIAKALRGQGEFPEGYKGSRTIAQMTELFDACVRIGCEAECPIVIENVRGAQPWVGQAKWFFGSFGLWGDVPTLMPITMKRTVMKQGIAHRVNGETNFHGRKLPGNNGPRRWDEREVQRLCDAGRKNEGGIIGSPGQKEVNRNPVHKLAGQQSDGQKTVKDGLGEYGGSFGWDGSPLRRGNSKSNARKAASATIAKIPFALASWIARVWKPKEALLSR